MSRFHQFAERVRQNINRYIDMPEKEWLIIKSRLQLITVGKGELLLEAGKKTNRIYYILEGCIRTFHSREDRELNYNFHFEDDWYAPYYSILTDRPCSLSVQALEDCTLFYLTIEDFRSMYKLGARWEKFGRLMAEKAFIEKEEKEEQLRFNNPEEHYKLLIEKRPRFINRIQQYHLASYLDITPETLSRIRSRIRNG